MQSHLKSHLGIRDCASSSALENRRARADFNFVVPPVDCPYCTKKFSRRHDRARHCSAVHNAQIDESLDRDDEFEG